MLPRVGCSAFAIRQRQMPENLMIPNVKEWLEKQGFLLEMKTAAAFRHAGFKVRQCSHYVDLGTVDQESENYYSSNLTTMAWQENSIQETRGN